MILQASGGLGLFLLGMLVMTNGLKTLAGDAMRSSIMRFTRSPFSGVVTGATSTAILQSSSATTVTAVGFVGAGLLGFKESLGIIFGANIGTTLKGWLIALLGFKFQLGMLMLPVLLGGVLIHIFARNRLAATGYTLAGFSLLFVGIDMMQQGFIDLDKFIQPDMLPEGSIGGLIFLVFAGISITLITQSSSAGVVTALTALYAGAINFEQAAAIVIGMDMGTTVTAALATIGGTINMRRTGYSHVVYNVLTGIGALFLIAPFVLLANSISTDILQDNAELALVAFHTSFNILGVIIALPFTRHLAALMIRLIPDQTPAYTRALDPALLEQTTLALNAAQSSINQELQPLLRHILAILDEQKHMLRTDLAELQLALNETHDYVDQIPLDTKVSTDRERLLNLIHTLDHMQRLHERCEEDEDRAATASSSELLSQPRQLLTDCIDQILVMTSENRWFEASQISASISQNISAQTSELRDNVMNHIADNTIDVPEGTALLEAIRWLERVSNHIDSICMHYGRSILASSEQTF